MKLGHSNVIIDKIERWPTPPNCCKLRLRGGASAMTCKELPPLALCKYEWEAIGKAMEWNHQADLLAALTSLCEYPGLLRSIEGTTEGQPVIDAVRAAISKAIQS